MSAENRHAWELGPTGLLEGCLSSGKCIFMDLIIDGDVQAVAEFMQVNIPATRLVAVATHVAAIAPILWGIHPAESVIPLRLAPSTPISGCDLPKQSCAKESAPGSVDAGGGSEQTRPG
jgi:hypothetical protein